MSAVRRYEVLKRDLSTAMLIDLGANATRGCARIYRDFEISVWENQILKVIKCSTERKTLAVRR